MIVSINILLDLLLLRYICEGDSIARLIVEKVDGCSRVMDGVRAR